MLDYDYLIISWLRNKNRLLLRFPAENEVLLVGNKGHLESILQMVHSLDEALVLVEVLSVPQSLHLDHFHLLVICEPMGKLLLNQINQLKLLGFVVEIGMNQMNVVLGIYDVVQHVITNILLELIQLFALIYLDGLYVRYVVAPRMVVAPYLKENYVWVMVVFNREIVFYVQPPVHCHQNKNHEEPAPDF